MRSWTRFTTAAPRCLSWTTVAPTRPSAMMTVAYPSGDRSVRLPLPGRLRKSALANGNSPN